jgi:hypothetical protein
MCQIVTMYRTVNKNYGQKNGLHIDLKRLIGYFICMCVYVYILLIPSLDPMYWNCYHSHPVSKCLKLQIHFCKEYNGDSREKALARLNEKSYKLFNPYEVKIFT